MQQRIRRRTAKPRTAAELAQAYPLSVVIPAHNAAEHLRATLPALLDNDLQRVEIVIVDDCSSDDTAEVATALPGPVRVVRTEQRGGPAAARNRGTSETSHPWLLFLDADVRLPPQALFWIRESLDVYRHRPEVAGVLGTYSEQIPWTDFWSHYKNLYTCHLYRITDALSPYIHTPIFCVRRELLESAGGFDPGLATAEDFRLGVVLGSAGHRFVIDRRVAGQHLKRYTLGGILREDFRRIRDLRRLKLDPEQRRFSLRAHRWNRLASLILPGLGLALAVAAIWWPVLLYAAGATLVLFVLANFRFLDYCRRVRGWGFALACIPVLWLEMLWAEVAVSWRFRRPPE